MSDLFLDARNPLQLGAGDHSGNLLWRLQHGETPDAQHQPAAAVVLIGTNDLGWSMLPKTRGGLEMKDPTPCARGAVAR